MSWIPCGNCRRTDRGRLQYVYVTTFEGDTKVSWRGRFCADCVAGLMGDLLASCESHRGDGNWLAPEQRA